MEDTMSTNIRSILEQLERGEMSSEAAIQAMKEEHEEKGQKKTHYLKVNVSRLHDDQPRVNVRIPLSMVGLGLALGSKYAPELTELNLDQIVDDLEVMGDGTIVEVQDIEEDEHVLISIESA
jgi:Tfp pilus assembly ATPase PilU